MMLKIFMNLTRLDTQWTSKCFVRPCLLPLPLMTPVAIAHGRHDWMAYITKGLSSVANLLITKLRLFFSLPPILSAFLHANRFACFPQTPPGIPLVIPGWVAYTPE